MRTSSSPGALARSSREPARLPSSPAINFYGLARPAAVAEILKHHGPMRVFQIAAIMDESGAFLTEHTLSHVDTAIKRRNKTHGDIVKIARGLYKFQSV